MKTIYDSGPNYPSPLVKWGIDVSKMRRKAFQSYEKNYDQGVFHWPEFRQEFDYKMLMNTEANPKRINKNKKPASHFGRKNFLKYVFLASTGPTASS
ncbi:MAG: hypothetical protein ABIO55_13350 [Ginsengibacter sp.]